MVAQQRSVQYRYLVQGSSVRHYHSLPQGNFQTRCGTSQDTQTLQPATRAAIEQELNKHQRVLLRHVAVLARKYSVSEETFSGLRALVRIKKDSIGWGAWKLDVFPDLKTYETYKFSLRTNNALGTPFIQRLPMNFTGLPPRYPLCRALPTVTSMSVSVPVARLMLKNPTVAQGFQHVTDQLKPDTAERLHAVSQQLLARPYITHIPITAPTYIAGRIHPVLHTAVEPVFNRLLQVELQGGKRAEDVVAPFGSPDAELMIMLHFPPENKASSIYQPRECSTIWSLACKPGIEDLSVPTAARDHGLFLFDVHPVKAPASSGLRLRDLKPHNTWPSVSLCGSCRQRRSVSQWALRPHPLLSRCSLSVCALLGTLRPPVNCRVLFEYASPNDKAAERILRVVFQLNHPSLFGLAKSRAVTPNPHTLLAAERFLDLALLLSVGQIARPAYLGCTSTWHSTRVAGVCMNLSEFDERDAVAREKLMRRPFAASPTGKFVLQSNMFSAEHIRALYITDAYIAYYAGQVSEGEDSGV